MMESQVVTTRPYAIRKVHTTGVTIPIRLVEKYKGRRYKVEIIEESQNYFIVKFTEI